MKNLNSAMAVTEAIDMREAADEIIGDIRQKITFQNNSVGLLYYDYEMDGDLLSSYLSEEFGIDILGCSTIATLDNEGGYRDMTAMLTVFTADDCEFHVGVTEALDNENAMEKIHETFVQTKERANSKPELVFAFFPCGTEIVFDKHLEDLSAMTDHVPIIGGIPSSKGLAEKSIVLNGTYYLEMAAILIISGNISPVFSLANVISTVSDRKDLITRAEGTEIYEVGGRPFIEFIESFGIKAEEAILNEDRIFFQQYPLLIESKKTKYSHEVPFVRILDHVDLEKGSGVAYAGIPQGAWISLALLRREDIVDTVRAGLLELFRKMQEAGGEFTAIVCITCAARHTTLNPYYEEEGNCIKKIVGSRYQLSGFYSFGELCPIAVENKKANNQFHNASIIFCAL